MLAPTYLWERMRRREMKDVEQLYLDSRQALTVYFLRRHRSAHVAEDLLQETFLRLIRRVEQVRLAGSPRGYLFGIARHVSADAWRRGQGEQSDQGRLAELEAPRPDQRLAAARETIAGMPDLQREILELRFHHDLSYAEMAEALGIPMGTVRSRLHNALHLLREQLENE